MPLVRFEAGMYSVVVGAVRFELTTSWSQTMRATAALRPEKCGCYEPRSDSWRPWGDSNARTWLRRPVLYPLSYRGTAKG